MDEKGQILLYQTANGTSRIEVRLQNETIWLTLDQMEELFQRNKSTISRRIKNILETAELQADSTVAFFATVQAEGNRLVERTIAFYNLDTIISVGYRFNFLRCVLLPDVIHAYFGLGSLLVCLTMLLFCSFALKVSISIFVFLLTLSLLLWGGRELLCYESSDCL